MPDNSSFTITIIRQGEFDYRCVVNTAFEKGLDPSERLYLTDMAVGLKTLAMTDPGTIMQAASAYRLGSADAAEVMKEMLEKVKEEEPIPGEDVFEGLDKGGYLN